MNAEKDKNYSKRDQRVFDIDKGIICQIENYRKVNNKPNAFTCVKEGMLNFKSSKTSSMDEYRNYLKHYGQNVIEILKFNMFNTT